MKKVFVALALALLAILCVFSLVACGEEDFSETFNVTVGEIATTGGIESESSEKEEHKHTWDEYEVTRDATCEEEGIKIRFCECGETDTAKIPAKGHDLEKKLPCQDRKCLRTNCTYVALAQPHDYNETIHEATCKEIGYTEYECACGEKYIDDETELASHKFGEWECVKEANCEENGQNKRVCDECGAEEEQEIISSGHKYEIEKVIPNNCTEQGYTKYVCEYCKKSYNADFVAPKRHLYADDFECHDRVCQREDCDWIEIASEEHDYDTETVSPNCVENGYTIHTCKTCGYTYRDTEAAALGHDCTDVVTAATCTTAGYTTHSCKRCDYTATDTEVDALGHDCTDVITAPTCTTAGYTTHTCKRCDYAATDSEVEALGHDCTDVVTEPTCTTAGYTTHACKRCDYTATDTEVEALGHNCTDVVTAPTCTTAGYTTHTCKRCDYTATDSEVESLGHDYNDVVTAPTCTTAGFTTHTCKRCDYSFVDTEVEALGHDYQPVEGENVERCACGDERTISCAHEVENGICKKCNALDVNYESTIILTCDDSGVIIDGYNPYGEKLLVIPEYDSNVNPITGIAENAFYSANIDYIIVKSRLDINQFAFIAVGLKAVYLNSDYYDEEFVNSLKDYCYAEIILYDSSNPIPSVN